MHIKKILLAVALGCGAMTAQADVLSKSALHLRNEFISSGANQCADAMAETMQFLSENRPFDEQRQWSTTAPNANPIVVDFVVAGNETAYSRAGSVSLVPAGGKCRGEYTYTQTEPASNCGDFIKKEGFDGPDWKTVLTGLNGDGGKSYFLSVLNKPNLTIILNDVAGGCSLIKREELDMDKQ